MEWGSHPCPRTENGALLSGHSSPLHCLPSQSSGHLLGTEMGAVSPPSAPHDSCGLRAGWQGIERNPGDLVGYDYTAE